LETSAAPFTALMEGANGELWAGTGAGLARRQNGAWQWVASKETVARPDTRALARDATGAVWFGMSGGGLGCWKDEKLAVYTEKDGLPNRFVWALHDDGEGGLWIGTFGGGLCRRKDGRFATLRSREGLPNQVICHIEDDGLGFFWISSYAGIFRASKSDLNDCAEGKQTGVQCLLYGKGDGLATLECSGGCQAAGCRGSDGRLWFPTSKGLAIIDPRNVRTNPIPPKVVIEELLVDGGAKNWLAPQSRAGKALDEEPAVTIPPGARRFQFRYTALSLVAPERVRFRYRLAGLEKGWEEAGPARTADYSPLPPGPYVFQVAACNNDGVWNMSGASVALTVLPYFWQTWWFGTAIVLAASGMVAASVRSVTKRRMRRKLETIERQRLLERERTRIAKDIHDDLGASLTRITLLSQTARADLENPARAEADLEQIYQTARELTRAMDEIVWAVNPQHDTLDSLVTYLGRFAQDFLSLAGLRCRLDVPMDLPAWPVTAETRHNLYLAFKEVLQNAFKHAGATEVRLSLKILPDGFCLLMEDNGRGFDRMAPLAPTAGGGNGLENMRKRLEQIGGTCSIDSRPGEGSRVEMRVPIKPAPAS
jgi:signal transduction histidine kinase